MLRKYKQSMVFASLINSLTCALCQTQKNPVNIFIIEFSVDAKFLYSNVNFEGKTWIAIKILGVIFTVNIEYFKSAWKNIFFMSILIYFRHLVNAFLGLCHGLCPFLLLCLPLEDSMETYLLLPGKYNIYFLVFFPV